MSLDASQLLCILKFSVASMIYEPVNLLTSFSSELSHIGDCHAIHSVDNYHHGNMVHVCGCIMYDV